MAKTCASATNCSYPVFSNKMCLRHQIERTDDKWIRTLEKKKVSSQGLKTSLVRSSQIANKPRKAINKVSDKMKENLALYRVLRDQYLKDHPVCQFPNCTSTELDLHHLAGRCGSLLTDVRNFCGLCRTHHIWVGDNHSEALKMGLVKDHLTV